ncbi:hypothetical protein GY45DRAFT_1322529 [Cubamyces sp. BRFM 1775]|nr:hypothetical protein GY45DRAFT_1322529 [Cubamyces sp. BRFM 1775]
MASSWIRHPSLWLSVFLVLSLLGNLALILPTYIVVVDPAPEEPLSVPHQKIQYSHPLVDDTYLEMLSLNTSENAIVTILRSDALAVPIATLGHSLDKVNSTVRRIALYVPGRVSPRALCIAALTGFEPKAISPTITPAPAVALDADAHPTQQHFRQAAGLEPKFWDFEELGLKAVVYLDASTLARRNFDELFTLPFAFAAVPDARINNSRSDMDLDGRLLFFRPSAVAFQTLLARANITVYARDQEQAITHAFYGPDALRLPQAYSGDLELKRRSRSLWEGLQAELRLIHYSLVQPFWRGTHDDVGLEGTHEIVRLRASDWDGAFREEVLEWGGAWRETEETHRLEIMKCSWKHGMKPPNVFLTSD